MSKVFAVLIVLFVSALHPLLGMDLVDYFESGYDDCGRAAVQTADGGFVVIGYRDLASEIWLIKTDSKGNKIWDKTFGGSSVDKAYSIIQSTDGGYVIAGSTKSYGSGGADLWLIKTDSNGNKIWDKTFGGINDDDGRSVIQTFDGGYAIAGSTWSYGSGSADFWLIKTDSNGNKIWDKTFGGIYSEFGYSAVQLPDGGFAVAGSTQSFNPYFEFEGTSASWLIKTDQNGNEVWNELLTSGESESTALCVVSNSIDGTISVTACSYYYHQEKPEGTDIMWSGLITVDSTKGDVIDSSMSNKYYNVVKYHSLQRTNDGGYILAGRCYINVYSNSSQNHNDLLLVKTDSTGAVVWRKYFGGLKNEGAYSVQQTDDGGYIITGYSDSNSGDSDVLLLKTDSDGDAVFCKVFDSNTANNSQFFTDANIVLSESQLKYSTMEWGDFDSDGLRDIMIAGLYSTKRVTKLYKNNGNGAFTEKNTILPSVDKASIALGDYDNDNDLDILISGDTGYGFITGIYQNDGTGNFIFIDAGLQGVANGASVWGDLDNDGDLDILITGLSSSSTPVTKIYRNDGNNIFTMVSTGMAGVSYSAVDLSDYDKDGDMDILVTGDTGSGFFSRIYRNEGNFIFTDATASLQGVKEGSVSLGDYDNDGDTDILLTGYTGTIRTSKIYRNDGSGAFEDTNIVLQGVNLSSTDWGDYDNDGDLDILLTGFTGSAYISKIYQNYMNGAFADMNSPITGICYGSAKWDDYDKDGDLDVFLAGMSPGSVSISKFYRNNNLIANTNPAAPAGLSSVLNGDEITLSWNKATDGQTSSYNLYIGAVSQGCQVVSPMSNISTGYRKIVSLGNACQDSSWTIKDLPFGTYYWSVQAIDNGFAGSLFSAEQTFVIDPFMETDSLLTGIYGSSSAWGDYDNDGDLDILMAGDTETGPVTKLYRNDLNAVFTEVSTDIQNMYLGSTAWGDYDNDGDLDILITGYTDTAYLSKIYRNDGSGVFTDINAGLTGCGYGTGIWGDYDNDGDLDILLTGYVNSTTKLSEIYRNDNGVFTDINAGLINVSSSSAAWGDYDSDGDIDILLTGYSASGAVSLIYRNDNGVFTNINAALTGVFKSSVAWGDYDNDGDLDILLTGMPTSTTYCSKVYRNDGSGVFTDIAAPIPNIGYSSVAWGDYNNDGYTDIFMCGYTGSVPVSKIFKNTNGTLFSDSGVSLTGVRYSSIALGDMDNDNDLDILLSGTTGTEYVSKIYKNNITAVNTKPSTPASLSSVLNGSEMTLSWNKTTDGQTPQNGLSYNLYIGTSPLIGNKKSPMSSISTGYRKVVSLGNAGSKNAWSAKDLPPGTYYWSVQAVDNAYAGSLFGEEKTFTVDLSVPSNVNVAYAAGNVTLSWTAVPGAVSYKVYASEDPFGVFSDVSAQGTLAGTSWSQTVTGNKIFYYVVAVTAKEENINQSVKEEK